LAVVIIVSANRPTTGKNSANVQYVGIRPRMTSEIPNNSAPPTTMRNRG
jgi:hypothetical protein